MYPCITHGIVGIGTFNPSVETIIIRPAGTEKAITSPDWTGGKVYYQSGNV